MAANIRHSSDNILQILFPSLLVAHCGGGADLEKEIELESEAELKCIQVAAKADDAEAPINLWNDGIQGFVLKETRDKFPGMVAGYCFVLVEKLITSRLYVIVQVHMTIAVSN